ncbi:inverse autotransporter beta domain-containing protein [Xenorhabdus khoisanae]|uniref:inverse autotransporter beta domain-containing protein n=1 Tax=Xenorhabdus khoisanae TaxID=880157 RepID=UPI0032B7EAB1
MLSYISKIIGFFVLLYTLLIPSTITNAFAEGNVITGKTNNQKESAGLLVKESGKKFLNSTTNEENDSQKKLDTSEGNAPNVITQNIQATGNILSSSPSTLAEQAKSYALGKFNNTVSSEAQKWLSQFGTARINFGLDKKGSLENNSFDLLIPLYDNKTDWLFFSQLGYRHKDSRNTINAGFGGRYFYQNWMYGLNTFYDHDVTGKNQRLGLGGEIWSDYIKLSANTYYRLSDWQKSRDFKDHHERPANGYDINGEFFLPTYPNLGAKLSYEQYFGDNVTLFNRDTKQKNPVLAKVGLNYTPIPLVTMGVDYKQGESGHTETQFLANLNYKLGVPLDVQLSPENVASMRTLAGSRYDLVERNNNIVLDQQKISDSQLSLPEKLIGYSQEYKNITATLSSNPAVKHIHWDVSEGFKENGGLIPTKAGESIQITLPRYSSNQNNNYQISAIAELENNRKLAPVQMNVVVRPFMVKKREEANFTPTGPLPDTGNKEDGYTFNPVITFDTENGAPIKNVTINDVKWITDPPIGSNSGLQFIDWGNPTSIEVDENGQFKHKLILASSKIQKDVKVYLQMDGQPQQLVGQVSFNDKPANYHVEIVKVDPPHGTQNPKDPKAHYKYTAVVLDSNKNPLPNTIIPNVKWSSDSEGVFEGVKLHAQNGDVRTDDEGKLKATLTSTVSVTDVWISLAIGEHIPVYALREVSFIDPDDPQ